VSRADTQRALGILGDGAILAGRLDGTLASVAFLQPSRDGLAEVAGVATLEAFRRRGIAGALTSAALGRAFRNGVALALLSAANEPLAGSCRRRIRERGLSSCGKP
jgi:ribosomal protein S18 acetylase RimI-like enzyme